MEYPIFSFLYCFCGGQFKNAPGKGVHPTNDNEATKFWYQMKAPNQYFLSVSILVMKFIIKHASIKKNSSNLSTGGHFASTLCWYDS